MTVPPRLAQHVIAAVQNVFRTMLRSEVEAGVPTFGAIPSLVTDVSAVVEYSGGAAGRVVLRFPMTVAEETASAFATIPVDRNNVYFADALGELADIVAGQAKCLLKTPNVTAAMPSVMIGADHALPALGHIPCLRIPLRSKWGQFCVEIAIRPERSRAPAS